MKYLNSSFPFSLLPSLPVSEKWIAKGLKICVSIAAFIYIISRLYHEQAYFSQWFTQLAGSGWGLLGISILLIPINWGLEAVRWKRMMSVVYPQLSFFNALRAIFAGIATGMFTPNRIGEYVGRMWVIPKNKRIAAVTYTFLNRIYQMQVTLIMGTLAFEYMYFFERHIFSHLFSENSIIWIRYGLWTVNGIAWIGLIFPQWLNLCLLRFLPQNSWITNARKAIQCIEFSMLRDVLSLGIVRYLVFSLQYYCLMLAFGYEGVIGLAFAMIGMIFLLKSMIPFVAVAELGIRESVAITVMGLFLQSSFLAFSSTFILYILNIIFPALVGLWIVNQKSPK